VVVTVGMTVEMAAGAGHNLRRLKTKARVRSQRPELHLHLDPVARLQLQLLSPPARQDAAEVRTAGMMTQLTKRSLRLPPALNVLSKGDLTNVMHHRPLRLLLHLLQSVVETRLALALQRCRRSRHHVVQCHCP